MTTSFTCHVCRTDYNSADELVNHWLEFRDFQNTGLKELLQMFVKFIVASKKLGVYEDIAMVTNLFSYDDLYTMTSKYLDAEYLKRKMKGWSNK